MTFLDKIRETFEQIGNDVRAITTKVGVLENLPTEAKDSIVKALIEINDKIEQLDTKSIIDDKLEESDTKTYSVNRIKSLVDTSIARLVNDAPEAMDTLAELANYIEVHGDTMTALQEATNDRVAYTKQTKTEQQKRTARENIGAAEASALFGIGPNEFTQQEVFSGSVFDLPEGNYTTPLSPDLKGLPQDISDRIGVPVSAIVFGGKGSLQVRIVVGTNAITYWTGASNKWVVVVGNFGDIDSGSEISETILVDISMVSGSTVTLNIGNEIEMSKRFDLYCNGVLIFPDSIEVKGTVIVIDGLQAGYHIKEGDVIVLKYVKK